MRFGARSNESDEEMADRLTAYLRRATSRRIHAGPTSSDTLPPQTSSASLLDASTHESSSASESIPLISHKQDDLIRQNDPILVTEDEEDDGGFSFDFNWRNVRASIRKQKSNVDLLRKRARYYVPILSWLPKYQWRQSLIPDRTLGNIFLWTFRFGSPASGRRF